MFEGIINFFKRKGKKDEKKETSNSRNTAKERLHLVLMQDRANVSADFLELMKQEIIEVIKKYIEIDEGAIDVRLTNKENEDGTNGAPALYANIPILNIKHDVGKSNKDTNEEVEKSSKESSKELDKKTNKDEKKVQKNENGQEKDRKSTEEKTDKIDSKTESKKEQPKEVEKKETSSVDGKKHVKSKNVEEKE